MVLTGDLIDGVKAEAWGLISETVSGDELDDKVNELANRVSAIPTGMLAMQKMIVN